MKRNLVILAFVLMVAFIAAAYYCPSPFWQAVALNAGTSFMALGVALIFVNVYLERSARKGAVKSLLLLSHQAIADFHNYLLDICWAKFGRDEWGNIGKEYLNSGGKFEALKHEVREFLYETARTDKELHNKIDNLSESLTELSRMVGWDLDVRLLEACLDSRVSISRFKDVEYDGSDEARNAATEHLMDSDIRTQTARHLLMTIAGISDRN
jgi:hypothetical protein